MIHDFMIPPRSHPSNAKIFNVPRKNTRECWIFPLRLLKKGSLKPPQYAHNCLHTVFMCTLVFGLKSRHESNKNPYTYLETTVVSISYTSYNIREVTDLCNDMKVIYTYIEGGKRQINYKFIPKSLFGGCPLIRGFTHQWATT